MNISLKKEVYGLHSPPYPMGTWLI